MIATLIARAKRRDEAGYTLVVVMLLTTLVIIMLSTAVSTLASNIRPAASSRDDGAALAAAEAGIEDFLRYANLNCSTAPLVCPALTLGLSSPGAWPADVTVTQGTTYRSAGGALSKASFLWKIIGCDAGPTGGGCAGVRLEAVGQFPKGGGGYRTKTLVADVLNSPNLNDFQYYTHFETLSPDYLKNMYPARNIHIDHTQLSPSDYNSSQITGPYKSVDGTLHWGGVPAAQLDVCNALYAARVTGMSTGAFPNTPPPGYAGSDFAWFSEAGTFDSLSLAHWDICDVAFEREMQMNGPLYTQDQYLLNTDTNASCPGSNSNKQPLFGHNPDGSAAQSYSLQSAGPGDYRTYATFLPGGGGGGVPGGDECTTFPVSAPPANPLDLKDGNTLQGTFLSRAQCVYTGPTRFLSKSETVLGVLKTVIYVTSPNTPVNNADPCYTNYNPTPTTAPTMATNNPLGGVVQARIVLDLGAKPIFYVKNPTTWTPMDYTTLQPAVSRTKVFDLQGVPSAPVAPTDPTLAASAWSDGWSGAYNSTSSCPTPSGTKRRTFDCENSTSSPAADVFTAVRTTVNTYLATSSGQADATFKAGILTALKPLGTPASWTTTAPSLTNPMTNGEILYVATATKTGTTLSTATGVLPQLPVADPFLQTKSAGSAAYTRTKQTWTVDVTRYTCAKVACTSDSGSTAWVSDLQYHSASVTHYLPDSAASTSTALTQFPWVGAGNYQQPTDLTPYDPTAGDAYVEGTLKKAGVEIVSDNDIFITNATKYDSSDPAKTDGWAFVAGDNIRIYRPVSCTYDDPTGTTSPNFCPNDLTGADDTPSQQSFSSQYPPSLMYCAAGDNGTPCAGWSAKWLGYAVGQSGVTNLYGTFFTMGYTDPSASARRGGSFMVDNVGRASDNGTLLITGGLYQYHRGITKFAYKLHSGGINRPGLTFHYAYDNMKDASNKLRVALLPLPSGSTSGSHKWSITGLSTP